MILLALDLGATIGCAAGDPAALRSSYRYVPEVFVEAWALPKGDRGRRFASAENEVIAAIKRFKPDVICKEAQLHPSRGKTTANVIAFHSGLHALVESAAWRSGYKVGVNVIDVPADEVRNGILGRCRLTREERYRELSMKDVVGTRLEQLGWPIGLNHNSADALALWLYKAMQLASRGPG